MDGAAPNGATWIERLTLTNFRNHARAVLETGPGPVVLVGANGAGKTNLLEAVSLLSPGRGLRRAPFAELARHGQNDPWAIAARLHADANVVDIGTGLPAGAADQQSGRLVRIDGDPQQGSGALGFVQMVWLTPSSDALFTGPASERRRFVDRLIAAFDAGHATRSSQFDRAMRQRNRLLEDGVTAPARFEGLETIMAETGVAISAARRAVVDALRAVMDQRRTLERGSPFPWAEVTLEGRVEDWLAIRAAVDAEDDYRADLARNRARDRAAGRTLEGPHRSDLVVAHGPKAMPARLCSTGEQKALLVGLVLAHAKGLAAHANGAAPILFLDEIAAHLDADRRRGLYREIAQLGAQAWLTGTDRAAFDGLAENARFFAVDGGSVTPD